jgi:hypothetical protein
MKSSSHIAFCLAKARPATTLLGFGCEEALFPCCYRDFAGKYFFFTLATIT